MTMSEKEKTLIPEALNTILQLPEDMQEKIIWIGQGMLLAGEFHANDGKTNL